MGIIEEALSRLRASGQSDTGHARVAAGVDRPAEAVRADRSASPRPLERIHRETPAAGPLVNLRGEVLARSGIPLLTGEAGGFGDDFKGLKLTVLDNAFGRQRPVSNGPLNVVMVTSSVEGEGKTFTSLNLALSLATERDHGVILIDADPIKRTLSRAVGLEGSPGLMDLVLDAALPLPSIISPTDVPGLRIIPAGAANLQSAELLGSRRMEGLAAQLAECFPDDIVLFDAPPLLMTHEARLVTKLVGQVLLVVQAGRTRQNSLAEAVSMIAPGRVAGVVLNRSNELDRAYRGGYYYGGYHAPAAREGE